MKYNMFTITFYIIFLLFTYYYSRNKNDQYINRLKKDMKEKRRSTPKVTQVGDMWMTDHLCWESPHSWICMELSYVLN